MGEGMHHIAFEVDDIKAEMKRLMDAGFLLLSGEPKKGADNKLICFLHPRDTNGVLIELCQEIR
jgi:methylmalonyl-CoA/ethylmalonyl-CoA epimerase